MRSLPLVAIRRRAAIALLLLTALTGGSYAVQRVDTSREDGARKVLDVTTRQEMLSQRVGLIVQALSGTLTSGQRAAAQQRLNRTVALMSASHDALRTGANGIPPVSTPLAQRQLRALGGPLKDFLAHARAVSARGTVAGDDPDLRYVRAAAQASLLNALKSVVSAEQAEFGARRATISHLRIAIVVVTLLVLPGATLMLVQPLLVRLRREVAFVELLQDVAVAANAATSVEEPIRESLKRVCSLMGWAVGHAYLLDRTNGVLASSAIWHLENPNAHEGFRRASEAIRLSPGVDLPGRVLVQRRPVC